MQIAIDVKDWAFDTIACGIKKYVDPNVEITLRKNLKKEPTLFLGGSQPKYPDVSNVVFCSLRKFTINAKCYSAFGPLTAERFKYLNPIEIPICCDHQLFDLKRKYDKKFVVAFVGNKSRWEKRYHIFESVMKLLASDDSIKFKTTLQISGNPPRPEILNKDMKYFYEDVDLILCTSSDDNGPYPCLEAGLMGIPSLICSDQVGFGLIMESDEYFRKSDDPVDLANFIKLLSNNRELAISVGLKAQKKLLEKYTFEINKEHWLHALNFMDLKKTISISFA